MLYPCFFFANCRKCIKCINCEVNNGTHISQITSTQHALIQFRCRPLQLLVISILWTPTSLIPTKCVRSVNCACWLTVVTGCGDGNARCFDCKSGTLKRTFKGHKRAISTLQVNTTYTLCIRIPMNHWIITFTVLSVLCVFCNLCFVHILLY